MIYTVTLNPAVDRELVVPAIEFDSVLRAVEWRVDWGGKGFNVSRVLASLGAASVAVGFAGGRSGELLRDGLNSLEIQTDFIDIQGETRTNVSIVSQSDNRYVKVNEPGPRISAEDLATLLARVEALAQAGDWWVLAGSLPPGISASTYADLTRILERNGAHVILDTSGQALEQGCRAAPELVKPNAYEAFLLTGRPVDSLEQIAAAGQAILQMGPAQVAVSLGKDGALLLQSGRVWLAHSPQIEERNPIGAGDSMVGGLVWGLSQGLEASEALRWGIACGAATASLSGTAVGTRQLVESLLAHTHVEPYALLMDG
jgi:1-phosphofructokinase family hexose kinase